MTKKGARGMAKYDMEETELPATGAAVIVGSHLPRLTSKNPEFPFGPDEPAAKTVCYFTVDGDGAIEWVKDHDIELEEALAAAMKDEVTVFAVWPGQWRSHLFVVDNPETALAEVRGEAMSSGALKAKITKGVVSGASMTTVFIDEVSDFEPEASSPKGARSTRITDEFDDDFED